MDEITLLSDAATKRFKAMYGDGKSGKIKSSEKHKMDDMLDEFKKLGKLEEVG